MPLLDRLALLLSTMALALAFSGCFVRSDNPAYYGGNGNGRGHPHGGPPGQSGGRGNGHGR